MILPLYLQRYSLAERGKKKAKNNVNNAEFLKKSIIKNFFHYCYHFQKNRPYIGIIKYLRIRNIFNLKSILFEI